MLLSPEQSVSSRTGEEEHVGLKTPQRVSTCEPAVYTAGIKPELLLGQHIRDHPLELGQPLSGDSGGPEAGGESLIRFQSLKLL